MAATTSRLLSLLSLLQTHRDWPGPVLADRLGISHRTVRRDVDRLREMGYTIQATMGPDGGYRLGAGTDLPPLLFDDDQAIALAIALRAASLTGVGIEEASVRALTTVRQVLPSRLRYRLDALEFATAQSRPGQRGSDAVSPDVLLAVSAAIRAREILRFGYSRAADAEPPARRRVEPHRLVALRGLWYLVAWDLDRDDWRIFRVDRIDPASPSGPRFAEREIPGGDAAAYVVGRFKGSDQGNAWPCVGKVILGRSAGDVVPFAGDGVVEDLGEDRCSLEIGAWSWVSLAATVGLFDAAVQVVRPAELAAAFGLLAERYGETAARANEVPASGR